MTIGQSIEAFKRYDYDKIVELFASITCNIPLSKQEFDRYHYNKKASYIIVNIGILITMNMVII